MRTVFLLPLTALVAVVAGCGSKGRDQARSVPDRDLTLVTQAPAVEIASPVETRELRIQRPTVRSSLLAAGPASARRSSRLQPKVVLASVAAPGAAPAAAEPVEQPIGTVSIPDNGRELLPGKTVTVIPASSGPSTGPDQTDDLPRARGRTMVTRGGGTCPGRGRGPGIGIATGPRPDFR
jgi:hypothetical protein